MYSIKMSDEEQARDEIEEIAINDEPVDSVQETVIEEEAKPVKAKPEAKAQPKTKITKEPIEPIEHIKEEEHEPIVEEKPKKINKNKQTVKCPDCNLSMTQHTLKYIHEKRKLLQRSSPRGRSH